MPGKPDNREAGAGATFAILVGGIVIGVVAVVIVGLMVLGFVTYRFSKARAGIQAELMATDRDMPAPPTARRAASVKPAGDAKYIVGAVPSTGGNSEAAKLAGERAAPIVFGTSFKPTIVKEDKEFNGKPSWGVGGEAGGKLYVVLLVEDGGSFVAVRGMINLQRVFENKEWLAANEPAKVE